uniref:Uncharacterized protein n=1 Tax=Theropithecus gelada TaxID=9565 RepID=A0A8D2GFK0_THEGE
MTACFNEQDCKLLNPKRETLTHMLLELTRSLFNRMDFEDLGMVGAWSPGGEAVLKFSRFLE